MKQLCQITLNGLIDFNQKNIRFYQDADELVKLTTKDRMPLEINLQIQRTHPGYKIHMDVLPHNKVMRELLKTGSLDWFPFDENYKIALDTDKDYIMRELLNLWSSSCIHMNQSLQKVDGQDGSAGVYIGCNIKELSTSGLIYLCDSNVDMVYENTTIPFAYHSKIDCLTGTAIVDNIALSIVSEVSCRAKINNATETEVEWVKGCSEVSLGHGCSVAMVDYPAKVITEYELKEIGESEYI